MNLDTLLKPLPKRSIFGMGITAATMDEVVESTLEAARSHISYGVTALAVHGLMEAVTDPDVGAAVSSLDIVAPDGQPVRWALRLLHAVKLPTRVYGPDLMRNLCARAANDSIGIYLYGSTPETCAKLVGALKRNYPRIKIGGVQPDRFREATPDEDAADVSAINASGAGLVFIGRGCPRQEKWTAAHRGRVNAAMIAVGAAFDFLSGSKMQAPNWMQKRGLEWLFRLVSEPGRLWKRYLITNSLYVGYLIRALIAPNSFER
jgi:N-acetylglucosaminyldiphosphoundecaprenol N-acetyl-beta-D-mannosaminyltransferase